MHPDHEYHTLVVADVLDETADTRAHAVDEVFEGCAGAADRGCSRGLELRDIALGDRTANHQEKRREAVDALEERMSELAHEA